jgi:hypothetical protein
LLAYHIYAIKASYDYLLILTKIDSNKYLFSSYESKNMNTMNDIYSRIIIHLDKRLFIRRKYYTKEINCKNSSSLFFDDCNSFNDIKSITMNFVFNDTYILYNCFINTFGQKCISNCSDLIESKYDLVVLNNINNETILPAWKFISNCKKNIYTLVDRDFRIPC